MNDVYFGCQNCRVFVEAGYRWAYWQLERRGVVECGKPVSPEAVRAMAPYWAPPDEPESKWLTDEVLPTVRAFLERHGAHRVMYGEFDDVVGADPVASFDWLKIGGWPELSPRYFAEVLRHRTWDQVVEWARTAEHTPWWWDDSDLQTAKAWFQEVVSAGRRGIAAEDQLPSPDELRRRKAWFDEYTARLDGQPADLPLRCPCCLCKTLYERGRFEECPVCSWEDDGQDDYDAAVVRGGPNGALSLSDARANYRRLGAYDARALDWVRLPLPDELPDESQT